MPRNPLYNNGRIDAQNNGLTHDNKASNPIKKYSQGMNTFNNSYKFANTERFADITPFMYLDCVSRDVIPFRTNHKLSSYTLQSPMMDEIFKHKFYSLVPYRAILPNTWELFYTNPTKGDDVPDDVYCNIDLITAYFTYYNSVLESYSSKLTGTGITNSDIVSLAECTIASELIFSTGSLLSSLKYNFWPYFFKDRGTNFDVWYNNVFVPFFTKNFKLIFEVQPGQFLEVITSDYIGADSPNGLVVTKHTFLDYARVGNCDISVPYTESDVPSESFALEAQEFFGALSSLSRNLLPISDPSPYKIDLSAVIAYQITCLSQATDASIDYIFNANLFRNVLFPLPNIQSFFYNGQYVNYETFSRKYLEEVWFAPENFFSTCQKLFSFAKSLKFGDYFTQMRPQPYAVGDLSVDIVDNKLDIIESTRRTVYQRFLNWNNRVGPKYEDYIAELTGISPMPDNTEPALITHTKEVVGSYEVENTGEAQIENQNSVTTLLRQTSNGFAFDILVSEPSILLGLTSYDMERLYTRIMDRSHLKESRFDFFNPMLQYTGDQDIKACELDSYRGVDEPIGYNTKDIHYKMQVSHASGGFIVSLPSWAFTTEDTDNDMSLRYGINPEFIRNTNGDFDRFFKSETGYSLGTYFHFILKYKNDFSEMQRAMDVAPDIL